MIRADAAGCQTRPRRPDSPLSILDRLMTSAAIKRTALALVLGIGSPACGDAVVTFHELNYNPADTQDAEWLELHNQMAVHIDLTGWSLADGITYQFPAGTVIPAGGFLVVAKNPALSGVPGALGPYSGNLSNSGESIGLLSASGRLMDRVDYGDSGAWPLAADGVGATLAKRLPGADSGDAGSWTASAAPGGTPGAANFPTPGALIRHALVDADSVWRFNDTGSEPSASWRSVGFDDSSWQDGQGAFATTSTVPQLPVTGGLVERYQAAAITGVTAGSTFPTWPDGATGDGVSQNATAGGNPTYQTGAAPLPVVRFDGNDEFRTSVSPGIPPGSGFVYFLVCKANGAPENGRYILDRNNHISDPPLASIKVNNGRYEFQKRYDNNSGLGGPISTSSISTTDFQIVAIRRNPAASRFEIWVDGVLEGSAADTGENLTPQPLVIGRHATDANLGFNGDIAELLVYRDALSDTDFRGIGSYLEACYGLDTAFPDTSVRTSLAAHPSTCYFRKTFTYTGDPARTALRLNQTVADGAAVYLNGVEISRTHLPEGAAAHATTALSDISRPSATGYQEVSAESLVAGTNVLAVSLHKSPADTSAFFSAALESTESPPDPDAEPALRLNEIAGTSDAGFFIEIRNTGAEAVSTAGYRLSVAGGASFDLPAVSLTPCGLLSFTEGELGFRPSAGDKIVLRSAAGIIADVQAAAATPGGLADTRWIRLSAATPGAANAFYLTDDIVIHEICYKAPPHAAVPGSPPVTTSMPLLTYGGIWRYNQNGPNLPSGWSSTAHPTGGGWATGPGPFGYSNGTLPLTPGTTLRAPSTNNPFVITYYFETEFSLSAAEASGLASLTLSHMIDDGAVIYLNGVELTRINMHGGTVSHSTLASTGVATASVIGPLSLTVPSGAALAGSNRLSVEVHQTSAGSSDVAFGLQASATIVTSPGVQAVPETPSRQQWIELYNRGASAVDLGNWSLGGDIGFTFPLGETIAPGGYLVVARDPSLVAASGVRGPWSGSLSGKGGLIRLRDAAGNPADEVSYRDGGRWPGEADGGGSTLELRDARSDNSLPESWAASDETSRRDWETITYQGTASASAVGPDGQWNEFILGLLDQGEVWIDDVAVTENPGSGNVAMVSGGTFESGAGGWRFLGNHRDAAIIPEPGNPGNHVLRLRATGAAEHMHNHVETTLADSRSVVNGRTYQISLRVKWISGCNKLNTRLYYNRLARTTALTRTQTSGTPGAPNSAATTNEGPVFHRFVHSPAVPQPGESVTVTARAADPDGLGALSLSYARDGGAPVTVPMAATGGAGDFSAVIPGFPAGSVVRFHVAAADAADVPAASFFPARGPDSHALYQVDDGQAAANGPHNIRIVMDPADKALLYQTTNLMSNGRLGCTVIYDEREVYYNAGVRLKSSQRGRPVATRVGFNLSFNDDQLFRGVHKTIAIDRSEGQQLGAQEILYDHMMYASGGVPAEFNDLVKVIAPDPAHTSTAILQMARFGSEFLDSQFENGADGAVYEYELIYYPTTADANGYKLPQPDNVVGTDLTSRGSEKENYRWNFLTKNNEDKDDYSRVIAMCGLFDTSGAEFDAAVNDTLDVDQWLRALACSCASGAVDSFFSNANHNAQFYARPADGRVLYFPHDMDYFDGGQPIFNNTELQKLTADPARRRTYLGHLHHLCTTVFNRAYMAAWTSHYGSLLPHENFAGHLNYIDNRSNFILSSIHAQVSPLDFAITTHGGADFATSDTPVSISGQGWVNVREIRLAGSSSPLPTSWTSTSTWQTVVPVGAGANLITLEAVDFSGQVVGTDSITVTHTGGTQLPAAGNLVVSEIYYNPLMADDLSEFIELLNISPVAALDLTGLSFTQGITFTFPEGVLLAPGQRVLVVKNRDAFGSEFGTGKPVAGEFTGSLDNAGETITLRRADGSLVLSFSYSDDPPWPLIADTAGHPLVLIDPRANPDHSDPLSWRAAVLPGGTPGGDDSLSYADWKLAHGNPDDAGDADGDGLTPPAEYLLGGDPDVSDSGLGPVFSVGPDGAIRITITRRADAGGLNLHPESSPDLRDWAPPAGASFLGGTRLPGLPATDRLEFLVPNPTGQGRHFVRFRIH